MDSQTGIAKQHLEQQDAPCILKLAIHMQHCISNRWYALEQTYYWVEDLSINNALNQLSAPAGSSKSY